MIRPTQQVQEQEESPCTKNRFQTHFPRIPSLAVMNISMGLVYPLALDMDSTGCVTLGSNH